MLKGWVENIDFLTFDADLGEDLGCLTNLLCVISFVAQPRASAWG